MSVISDSLNPLCDQSKLNVTFSASYRQPIRDGVIVKVKKILIILVIVIYREKMKEAIRPISISHCSIFCRVIFLPLTIFRKCVFLPLFVGAGNRDLTLLLWT